MDLPDLVRVCPVFPECEAEGAVPVGVKALQAPLLGGEQQLPVEIVALRGVVKAPQVAVYLLGVEIAYQLPAEQERLRTVWFRAGAGVRARENARDGAVHSPVAIDRGVKHEGAAASPADIDCGRAAASAQQSAVIQARCVRLGAVPRQNIRPAVQ